MKATARNTTSAYNQTIKSEKYFVIIMDVDFLIKFCYHINTVLIKEVP